MQQYNQMSQPVAISDQAKEAIIAEMHEAIKILSLDHATTVELEKASTKTRFVSRLINLYLDDAFGEIRLLQPMYGHDQPFRQMYPQGYNPMSGMPYQSIFDPLSPLQGAFNASACGQGAFGGGQPNPMNNFMGNQQQPLNQDPGQQMGGMMFNGMGMGYQRPPVDPMQHAYNNIYGGQTYQSRQQQQRTSQQVRWADFGADKLIYSTVVPVPNVAPGVHTLIIRIADKPAPGAQLTPAAELDMYARTIRIFNHDEVLTADRLRIDGIKGMLEELTYEYIIGDKPFPHFSNEGMLLWNAVKQQPDQYYNWKVLNNRGEELTTIQLDHKDEA